MKKKKEIICILITAVLLGTAGCSYKEFEDSLRSDLKGENTESDENANTASINTESDGEKEANVYYVGDTAKFGGEVSVEGVNEKVTIDEIWYTLNEVDIVKDVNELGISMADFSQSFSNQDKISAEGKLQEGYSFISINVSVKNISSTFVDPDTGHNMLIDSTAAPESGISNQESISGFEAAYFSGHDDNKEKHYLKYTLGTGEEKDYTVGWVVPDELLEEPFYYVVGASSNKEWQKYFLLNGSEGDSR